MDIRPMPWLPQNAPASAPTGPAVQPQAWLRELEHARWQAQPRQQPASAGQTDGQPSAELPADAEHVPGRTPSAPQPLQEARRGVPAETRSAASVPREGPARSLPTAAAPAASQPLALPLAAQAFVAGELHRRRQGSNSRSFFEPAQPQADEAWARRSIHVHLGAEELSVWIRDNGLDPEAALALLDHLVVLHGPHPRTYRQVRLTVNGQPVDAAAHLPQHNLSYSGEHRGD
jgi:hypothetical protein